MGGVKANEAAVDWGRSLGLGGFFTFDTSMDSTKEKYKFHKAIEARMSGPVPPSPTPQPPAPTPKPPPTPAPTPVDAYRCTNNQCVADSAGVPLETCNALCGGDKYKCTDNQCVASSDGVAKATCEAICGGS